MPALAGIGPRNPQGHWMTTLFTYTSDFREEFEADTASLLRERFRIFLWTNLLLYFVSHYFLTGIAFLSGGAAPSASDHLPSRVGRILGEHYSDVHGLYSTALLSVVDAAIALWFVRRSRYEKLDSLDLVRLSQWAFFLMSTVDVASYVFGNKTGFPWSIVIAHVWACTLLPWSPKQALRPLFPTLMINAACILLSGRWSTGYAIGIAALTLTIVLPGYTLARLKHHWRLDRFKLSFLQSRYGQIRRELTDARKIHESLFPKPQKKGVLRFDYRYEPMRQIGGDYLYARFHHARFGEHPVLSLLLLDVTGHGIAAALTVNRLYGEVERLFAENPDARPADVLRGLNRYVHLTLATHSVYATALCLCLDPNRNELEYASGGHPPAFLRGVDGTLEELQSTSFVLGACADSDFDPDPKRLRFGPGDAVIAYTDGAVEARNEQGRMFGVMGLQRVLASIPASQSSGWSQALLNAVEAHRAGPARDDTLVVEIVRTLRNEGDSTMIGRAKSRDGIAAGAS